MLRFDVKFLRGLKIRARLILAFLGLSLLIGLCGAVGLFFIQRIGANVAVFAASGKGRLYSYVIHHRPVPGFTPPYAIAVVELDEGPRMMTNIVDCPQTPEALLLDMPLEIAFEKIDDEITLPYFRPV